MSDQSRTHGSMFIGGLLVILGIIFLINKIGGNDLGDFIGTWWPLILIVIGLKKMLTPGRSRVGGGLTLFLIGVAFQLLMLEWITWGQLMYIWPVLLIFFGLKLILRPKMKTPQDGTPVTSDTIDTVAIFGGTDLAVTSQDFKGGQATAIFGGVDINLRKARLHENQAIIHASAFFGGIDIVVPEGWQVETEGMPIFAALENNCKSTVPEGAPRLKVKASAIFGGIEIKN